jgi:hypothetical protein
MGDGARLGGRSVAFKLVIWRRGGGMAGAIGAVRGMESAGGKVRCGMGRVVVAVLEDARWERLFRRHLGMLPSPFSSLDALSQLCGLIIIYILLLGITLV